jgi:3',5'-nucleoside bisphosphate phosphatase
MKGTVDLHMHTTFSDGTWNPSDVVKVAAEHGAGIIAITDHDNIAAYGEAKAAADKFGVTLLRGAELSTTFHGKAIHIVALGFDPENATLLGLFRKTGEARKTVLTYKLAKLNEMNKEAGEKIMDLEDYVKYCGDFFGKSKTLKYMVANGVADDEEEANGLLHGIKGMEEVFPSSEEAIAAARAAGAVTVLAHPLAPKISLKNVSESPDEQKRLVDELVSFGLEGIESSQSSHSSADAKFALEIAEEKRLLVSGGTDWHGPLKEQNEKVMLSYIPYYSEFPGALKISPGSVAPLLERLGLDK